MKIIAAVDSLWNIGKGENLLFHISEDLKNFKNHTVNKTVILGRKTLETFPHAKPLKNRDNIILTHNSDFKAEGAVICTSVKSVLEEVKKYNDEDVFVIGGESVYNEFLPYCDSAIITKIKETVADADKKIFNFDNSLEWEIVNESEEKEENGIKFSFVEYKRK